MNTMRLRRGSSARQVALVIAVEHHVHALERKALRVVDERQDALGAQGCSDLRPASGSAPMGRNLSGIERLFSAFSEIDLHVLVVIMLQPAMRMAVIMVMIMPGDDDRGRDHDCRP